MAAVKEPLFNPSNGLFKKEPGNNRSPKDYMKQPITLENCLKYGWITLDSRSNFKTWETPTFVSQNPILQVFLSNLKTLVIMYGEYKLKQTKKNNSKVSVNIFKDITQQFTFYFNPALRIQVNDSVYSINSIKVSDNPLYSDERNIQFNLTYERTNIIYIRFPKKYFYSNKLPPPTEIKYYLTYNDSEIKNQTSTSVATLSSSESVIKYPLEPSPRVLKQNPPKEHSENENENTVYIPPITHENPPIELRNMKNGKPVHYPTQRINPGSIIGNEQLGGTRRTKKRKHRRSKTSKTKYRR